MMVCFCSITSTGFILAQTDLSDYQKIDILSGLAQNTVTTIYQDHTGFLWFGTTDGLSRYEGNTFTNFICNIDDPKTLSNNYINAICEDSIGNLYIGTEDGLNIYNRKNQNFKRIYRDTTLHTTLPSNRIYALEIDKKNRLWIGTYYGMVLYNISNQSFIDPKSVIKDLMGLDTFFITTFFKDEKKNIWTGTYKRGFFKFNQDNYELTNYLVHDEKEYAYLNNTIYRIFEDSYSNIWITTGNGIAKLDSEQRKIKRFIYSKSPSNLQNSIYFQSIYQTSQGRLLAGSGDYGMYEYNYDKEEFAPISIRKNESGYMSGNSYLCMLEDKSGVLWLGTFSDGVLKINLKNKPFCWVTSTKDKESSLIDNDISVIMEDSKKNIWVGTQQGISIWSRNKNTFKHLRPDPKNHNSISSNHILAIFEDSKKNIWIGTSEGMDFCDQKRNTFKHFYTDFSSENQLPENEIFSIKEDKLGQIWIATSYGLSRYDLSENKFNNYFYSAKDTNSIPSSTIWEVFIDSKNQIWLGTPNGLAKYIPSKDNFERHSIGKIDKSSKAQQEVLAIAEGEDGILWLGTTLHGIVKFNTLTNETKQYPIIHKLATNTVYSIKNYKNHVWFASVKGLGRLDKKTGEIIIFTSKDGIKSNEFNTPSALTNDSILVFGGTNGITYFKPEQIEIDDYQPPIVFTRLRINFNEISPGEVYNDRVPLIENINSAEKIVLNYNDNVFSVTFSSLDYKIKEKIEYAYKITGVNEEWIELGNQNTVNFTGLGPGKYTLVVRATNSDGVWNQTTRSLNIIIKPPWWKTILFYILLTVSVILLITYIIKRRESRLQAAKDFLEQSVEERTREIAMQKEEIESQKEVIEKQNKELKYHTLHLEDEIENRLADLILARDKAEESDRLKSAFLSNMSHEIRTPLNAIIGFSELLGEHDIPKEKQAQFLEIIKNNSNDLLNLFDKLINVSVIQSKKITLEESTFKVNKLLYELFIDFERKIRINSKDIELYLIDSKNDNNLTLTTDEARLKQVLSYLISNAIKYTEKGKIEFGYVKNGDFLEFFVKDTGIGIPKEKQFTLFNHFGKLEHSKEKVYRGTGLGLTISKDLIKLMGGKIWVESKEGKGTRFFFTIPIKNGQ
jgi:signal transduction histidine kinase